MVSLQTGNQLASDTIRYSGYSGNDFPVGGFIDDKLNVLFTVVFAAGNWSIFDVVSTVPPYSKIQSLRFNLLLTAQDYNLVRSQFEPVTRSLFLTFVNLWGHSLAIVSIDQGTVIAEWSNWTHAPSGFQAISGSRFRSAQLPQQTTPKKNQMMKSLVKTSVGVRVRVLFALAGQRLLLLWANGSVSTIALVSEVPVVSGLFLLGGRPSACRTGGDCFDILTNSTLFYISGIPPKQIVGDGFVPNAVVAASLMELGSNLGLVSYFTPKKERRVLSTLGFGLGGHIGLSTQQYLSFQITMQASRPYWQYQLVSATSGAALRTAYGSFVAPQRSLSISSLLWDDLAPSQPIFAVEWSTGAYVVYDLVNVATDFTVMKTRFGLNVTVSSQKFVTASFHSPSRELYIVYNNVFGYTVSVINVDKQIEVQAFKRIQYAPWEFVPGKWPIQG